MASAVSSSVVSAVAVSTDKVGGAASLVDEMESDTIVAPSRVLWLSSDLLLLCGEQELSQSRVHALKQRWQTTKSSDISLDGRERKKEKERDGLQAHTNTQRGPEMINKNQDSLLLQYGRGRQFLLFTLCVPLRNMLLLRRSRLTLSACLRRDTGSLFLSCARCVRERILSRSD